MTTIRVIKTYADGTDGPTVGFVKKYAQGYRFFPATPTHKPSRKFHKTFDTVIPKWAGGLNGTRSEYVDD